MAATNNGGSGLAGAQTLARQVKGDQTRRASSVCCETRSPEIEKM